MDVYRMSCFSLSNLSSISVEISAGDPTVRENKNIGKSVLDCQEWIEELCRDAELAEVYPL